MRKNKMLRLASGMMVATLLSTSVISGTFAKYVTTAKASDTAVVAKWGVTVSASGSLFGKAYLSSDGKPAATSTASGLSVKTGGSSTLVAPGTQSDTGMTFGISGQPEVSSKVSVKITAQDIYLAQGTYGVMEKATVTAENFDAIKTKAGTVYKKDSSAYSSVTSFDANVKEYYTLAYTATVGSDGYYPVKYTLAGGTTNDENDNTAAGIALKIAKKIESGTTKPENAGAIVEYNVTSDSYGPNKSLDTELSLASETLTWAWNIGSTNYTVGTSTVVADTDDARDTLLGDLMAVSATTNSTVVYLDGSEYKPLKINSTTGIVANASDKEVGSLKTEFNIAILVEQDD